MTPSTGVLDQTYTLADRYTREKGRLYLSGVQSLVCLPLILAAASVTNLGMLDNRFLGGMAEQSFRSLVPLCYVPVLVSHNYRLMQMINDLTQITDDVFRTTKHSLIFPNSAMQAYRRVHQIVQITILRIRREFFKNCAAKNEKILFQDPKQWASVQSFVPSRASM
jgi:hypothetical protein